MTPRRSHPQIDAPACRYARLRCESRSATHRRAGRGPTSPVAATTEGHRGDHSPAQRRILDHHPGRRDRRRVRDRPAHHRGRRGRRRSSPRSTSSTPTTTASSSTSPATPPTPPTPTRWSRRWRSWTASTCARSPTARSCCTSAARSRCTPKVALRNRDELSRAYTPGVARVCLAIAENPADARRLTIKRNTVAVVTDGSAVLGLGNLGPAAALPVMEGKAALFKRFGGVDAWPVVLDTQDTDEIVRIVQAIAPGVRRHQPGGHRRAALLRDRGAAARAARHPGLPRRPARHRDLRAGRADQRAARRRQAARGRPGGRLRRRRGRHGDHQAAAAPGRRRRHRVRPAGRAAPRACPTSTRPGSGWPSTPTATATPATCPARCAAPTCSSA